MAGTSGTATLDNGGENLQHGHPIEFAIVGSAGSDRGTGDDEHDSRAGSAGTADDGSDSTVETEPKRRRGRPAGTKSRAKGGFPPTSPITDEIRALLGDLNEAFRPGLHPQLPLTAPEIELLSRRSGRVAEHFPAISDRFAIYIDLAMLAVSATIIGYSRYRIVRQLQAAYREQMEAQRQRMATGYPASQPYQGEAAVRYDPSGEAVVIDHREDMAPANWDAMLVQV